MTFLNSLLIDKKHNNLQYIRPDDAPHNQQIAFTFVKGNIKIKEEVGVINGQMIPERIFFQAR